MSRIIVSVMLILFGFAFAFGQDAGNERSADRTLRGSGRINASTLAMEFDLPLGAYPGRGINVPINLSYSSKVWRLDYQGNYPVPEGNWSSCNPEYIATFAEKSASGWTTSMATPYIEYIGVKNLYDSQGKPISYSDVGCPTSQDEPGYQPFYVRRILVHLPSGETHEMRPDDTPIGFSDWTSDPYRPNNPGMWNATYYAADGSNLRYVQNSANGTYRLQMPDGSYYDFDSTTSHLADRKATKFTDRNGNYTTYHAPNSTYPNGYWTDTLGRTIEIPIGLVTPPPTAPEAPQEYSMPGMTGKYKFHWKLLKGSSAATSALTNYSQSLKYYGETYVCSPRGYPEYCFHDAGDVLFYGSSTESRVRVVGLFNPVLLTEIELPTGGSYKFTYDIYGRIEQIHYPTGGEEHFTYAVVPTLSVLELTDLTKSANFGVINRKVLKSSADQTPYEWTYSAGYEAPAGYRVSTGNPDGTLVERFLHRGNDPCTYCDIGTFGYDNGLAGMAYKELWFDNSNPRKLVSQKLTHWTKKTFNLISDWHPRVEYERTIAYDPNGSGDAVSATSTYEYEGDLNLRETPVLVKKTTQYAFEPLTGGSSLLDPPCMPEGEPCNPQPNPTPIPTATPPPTSPPVKIVETKYVIYDDVTYPEWVREIYKLKNMVGLVRSSTVKDGSGTVVSRSETLYDEGYLSPEIGRGNPTTLRVWDSTKGAYTSSSAYISTSARFDQWGNQIEASDARGNITTTTYDSTHHAFPIEVTSPVPDPTGQNGSNTAFTTTATFNYVTGLPLTTTDANGLETRIEYDPATLRPLNTKTYYGGNQIGSMAETIYHDEPNNYWVKNRAQIDENKWAESITYFDGLGRAWKSEKVDSDGNIFVEKEFDGEGRVLRVTNPFRANETKQWTTNVYDDASRVIEVVLPDGAKIKTDYGVSVTGSHIGTVVTFADQSNKQRRQISNSLGQTTRVDEPNSAGSLGSLSSPAQPTYYHYNGNGQMIRVEQGVQDRFFMYDSVGRLLRIRQPEQTVNTSLSTTGNPDNNSWTAGFTYDDNGNILSSKDARNITLTYGYDNLNRMVTRSYSDSSPPVAYKYDNLANAKGRLIEVSSSISTSKTTSFDNLGRPLAYQQITDGQTYTSTYEYNLTQLVKETYPSGREVRYDYNADGDLSRVWGVVGADQRTYANAFNYNSFGAVESLRLGNGRWETAKFNNRMQVTELGLGNSATDAGLWKTTLEYGELQTNGTVDTSKNAGNIAKQTLTVEGMTHPIVQAYKYDSLDRVTEAEEKSNGQQNWIQQFGYDRYGNRTSFNQFIGQTQQDQTPAVDPNTNRFSTGQGYVYDLNGNLIEDAEGRQFTFNGDNKQTEVKDSQSNVIGEYFYDGEGKRVKKVVPSTGEVTIFVYSGGKLVAEYSTELSENPTISYTTTDQLGSPRVITDAFGQVISRRDFMPYGEELQAGIGGRSENLKYSVTGIDNVRKRFTGYEKDAETGLDFAEARYYNNAHGRFTAVDPLLASGQSANPQTFNRYIYTTNNPVNLTDPSGLIPETTGACGTRCPNSYYGDMGNGAFFGRNPFASDNFLTAPETITVDLNIVYDASQYSRQQVEEAMKPQLEDLSDTFGQIAIEFNVTYTAGTVNSSRTEITSGAVEGSLNVFYFDDSKSLKSYSKYETGSGQIFISQKKGHAAIRAGSLSHEVGHAFGLIGSLTSTAVHYFGPRGNVWVLNAIDNVTSDVQIELANTWLRNGQVLYGRNWVDNYRTATERVPNASQQRHGIGGYRVIPRTPSVWDLYRDGARQIAAQKRR